MTVGTSALRGVNSARDCASSGSSPGLQQVLQPPGQHGFDAVEGGHAQQRDNGLAALALGEPEFELLPGAAVGGAVLRKEHSLARPLQGALLPDVALQGAQHTIGIDVGVLVMQLAHQRDGHQLRRALEQRHDFAIPDRGDRIGARAPLTTGRLRRQRGGAINAACAALADAGLGSGQLLGLGLAISHVEANLLIGDTGTWQWGPTSC
ncbi:MAG: hypothetical protein Q7U73_14050 [Rubrivivax sp.]|nr:hypothetical protein [Rubrivivax sp.]